MIDFKIIKTKNGIDDLNKIIKEHMNEGWIPLYPHVLTYGSYGDIHTATIGMYIPDEISGNITL